MFIYCFKNPTLGSLKKLKFLKTPYPRSSTWNSGTRSSMGHLESSRQCLLTEAQSGKWPIAYASDLLGS